jgi:hypothetical protein
VNLLELSFQRKKAKAEACGLLDKAIRERPDLTVTEQVEFDALTARIHVLDQQFAQRESLRKVVA